jgi:regulatory protein
MHKKREQSGLMQYALWLLGRRRYTYAELKKKLVTKSKLAPPDPGNQTSDNQTGEEIKKILNRLADYGYINDAQYAELYIQDQLKRKPQGIRLIKAKLGLKGVEKELICAAAQKFHTDENLCARRAAAGKIKSLKKLPLIKQKEKLARFLASRGFGTGTIITILDSLIENS